LSLPLKIVSAYLRVLRKPPYASEERFRAVLAAPKGDPSPPRTMRVEQRTIAGRPCYVVEPRHDRVRAGTIVYLHGGSYVHEIVDEHWRLVARLADEVACTVHVPIYGLAPFSGWRAAHAFLDAVWGGVQGRSLLMGDSAGGGLALAFAISLIRRARPLPAGLVLIAPWLDATLSNPEIAAVEAIDPWLARPGLVAAGRAWAMGDDAKRWEVSPIYAADEDVARLPPTTAFIGTHDILHPDVVALGRRAPNVTVIEAPGLMHVYPLVPIPEGRAGEAEVIAKAKRLLS